ncbi:MAG: hypothetical protein AABZ44_09225, partial [Elusimicrobiota bacterium]
ASLCQSPWASWLNQSPGVVHESIGTLALAPFVATYAIAAGAIEAMSAGVIKLPPMYGAENKDGAPGMLYALHEAGRYSGQIAAVVGSAVLAGAALGGHTALSLGISDGVAIGLGATALTSTAVRAALITDPNYSDGNFTRRRVPDTTARQRRREDRR